MRPFVNRVRMRLKDFDRSDLIRNSNFACCESEMRAILAKKKIRDDKAAQAINQTLEIAADHQLQQLRQNKNRQDYLQSVRNVQTLIKRLQELAQAIDKLPPVAKGKLNAIVAVRAAQFFDTETYADLIEAVANTLAKLSPRRRAQHALDVIDQPVVGVTGTAPSKLVELWETMSAETRRLVEEEVRHSTAPKSAVKFFRQLATLLNKHLPRAKSERRRTLQRQYIQRVEAVWASLGLKAGRAYSPDREKNIESSFQRFASLALAAVGGYAVISGRQIAELKKSKRHRAR